jgi:hypothetical protein
LFVRHRRASCNGKVLVKLYRMHQARLPGPLMVAASLAAIFGGLSDGR